MSFKVSLCGSLILFGSLVAVAMPTASERVLSKPVEDDVELLGEPSHEASTLGRLASALSSGREAMRSFRRSRSDDGSKARFDLFVRNMECHIDRLAGYVSCFSAPINALEAETLFARLVDELRAALPSDRWRGTIKQPEIASIRSYTYAHHNTKAHIDVDIIDRVGAGEQTSYMVSIFGWTY